MSFPAYFTDSEMGMSATHYWYLHNSPQRGKWRVAGSSPFCASGFAVMDDYGNLVEVPRV